MIIFNNISLITLKLDKLCTFLLTRVYKKILIWNVIIKAIFHCYKLNSYTIQFKFCAMSKCIDIMYIYIHIYI